MITAPSRTVDSPEKRRQAQLLSTLLLVMLVIGPAGVALVRRSVSNAQPIFQDVSFIALFISFAVLLICYSLSRTRHYLVAAALTLLITPLGIYTAILAAPLQNLDLTRYLVLGLLICGIMFSLRVTAWTALVYVITYIILAFGVIHIPSPHSVYSLIYLVIGAMLIITFMRYRDLTERDRQQVVASARDELRASRELYRTLAQNLPQSSVLLFDHDLRYLLVEGVEQIGYTKEMLEGKTIYEALTDEDVQTIRNAYVAALRGEELIDERVIGDQIYVIHYLPVKNARGAITAGMVLLQNITTQKQAEVALRESEERYRLMAENATDLIAVQALDGTYIYASPAARLLLGYDPEELIGRQMFEFLHPEDAEQIKRLYQDTLPSQEMTTLAYRIRRKDGSYTWFESASRLVSNPMDGEQIVMASRDISERMEASEALRRSEELFRSLIASMDSLVFSIDLSGHFLVYHPMPLSIYDTPFDTEVFIGKHYGTVLPEVLASKMETAISAVITTLSTQQIEYSLEVDGQERFFSARLSPMISTNLKLLGSTIVVSDVTEAVSARQREQRLLDLEQIQLQISALFLELDEPNSVIDHVLEVMGIFFDISRVYVFKLRENERLLDYTHEWCAPGVAPQIHNLQGIAYDELFPSLMPMLVSEGIIASEQINELPPDLYRALEAQGVQSVLLLPFYVDGRLDGLIGFDEIRRPRQWLPEETAAIRAFTMSLARVLERQRAQLALVEARDTALRSAKLKSEFVSNMSHEIRTPMTGVIGMLDLLRETNPTEEQKDFVELAHSSAIRLLVLINDILDFSKIEAGKVTLETIPMDVRGVITEVQSMLKIQGAKKQLQIAVEIDEDVPARVLGDPTRLRQILTNLVGNAIKFTEKGSIRISVRQINTTHGRTRLRFEVIDTGVGIPPDRQALIFDSFVQGDSSTTRRYGGAGLGLAICKQLVTLMGGEIDVTSTLGVGSTFGVVLTLPIVALATRALQNESFKYLQVLVMDEENTARYLLAEQLRLWGTNVIEASSPQEANELLAAATRRGEEVEILLFRCRKALPEQEALATNLRAEFGLHVPLLVQLCDDDTPSSPLFDITLRRPVPPADLYDLLLNHINGESLQVSDTMSEEEVIRSSMGARILIADDEPMNREIVIHALEQFGCIVDVAHNGQEALDLLDQHDYRLILMDVHMPIMDGLEATRRIRTLNGPKSQIPIIALTASIQIDERQDYLDAGISAIVGKPFAIRELRDTITAWMMPS